MRPRIAEHQGSILVGDCPFCGLRHPFPLNGQRGVTGWYLVWSACNAKRAFYFGGKRRKLVHFVVLSELHWCDRERFAT